jgi:hypothetical protein
VATESSGSRTREIAGNIDRAMLVKLPGDDHWPHIGDSDHIATEIAVF